jgi:P27 family predicted phage terminase small subunit
MAGRKAKPTVLRKLQGNPSKRPFNELEPSPSGGPLPPIKLSEGAQVHWDNLALYLEASGMASRADSHALMLFCDAAERYEKATRDLNRSGLIIRTSKSDYPMMNPLISIQRGAFDDMMRVLSEFGMTPSSRTRLVVDKVDEVDPITELISRKKRNRK